MQANNKHKLKLLFLMRVLQDETDSQRGLTMPQIIERLQEAGIPAERKAIYRELNDWISNTATILPIFHKVQPYVWVKDLVIPVNYPTNPQVYEWSWKN